MSVFVPEEQPESWFMIPVWWDALNYCHTFFNISSAVIVRMMSKLDHGGAEVFRVLGAGDALLDPLKRRWVPEIDLISFIVIYW